MCVQAYFPYLFLSLIMRNMWLRSHDRLTELWVRCCQHHQHLPPINFARINSQIHKRKYEVISHTHTQVHTISGLLLACFVVYFFCTHVFGSLKNTVRPPFPLNSYSIQTQQHWKSLLKNVLGAQLTVKLRWQKLVAHRQRFRQHIKCAYVWVWLLLLKFH